MWSSWRWRAANILITGTIAAFVSSMKDEILPLFRDVLLVCEEMNLLGGTMFALDGCKLPSNPSKEWSGTVAELRKKKVKIETKVAQLLEEQIQTDRGQDDPPVASRQQLVEKIETEQGRRIYPQRLAIAEPVFANIRTNKRLDRFTLRGKIKVNIQWLLFCLIHNIEKIVNYGLAFA